jgi:hypothetical protein
MPGKNQDVRAELTAVIEELHQSQQISGIFATSTMRMASAMRTFSEQVDGRFDVLEGRFDVLEGRFDVLEGRFDRLDTEVGLVRDDVRKMSARMEELFGRIAKDELDGRPSSGRRRQPGSTSA